VRSVGVGLDWDWVRRFGWERERVYGRVRKSVEEEEDVVVGSSSEEEREKDTDFEGRIAVVWCLVSFDLRVVHCIRRERSTYSSHSHPSPSSAVSSCLRCTQKMPVSSLYRISTLFPTHTQYGLSSYHSLAVELPAPLPLLTGLWQQCLISTANNG